MRGSGLILIVRQTYKLFALAKEVRESTGRTGQGFIKPASNFDYSTDSCI